jgi:HSP20 family protein
MDRAMDEMWRRFFRFPQAFEGVTGEWPIPLDIHWTKENVVVKAAIPGVKPEEMELTIEGNTLVLKAEAREDAESKDEEYMLREHRYGSFSRSVTLPEGLDTGKAEAACENGVLTVTFPRLEEVKPKSLKVKVATSEGKKT